MNAILTRIATPCPIPGQRPPIYCRLRGRTPAFGPDWRPSTATGNCDPAEDILETGEKPPAASVPAPTRRPKAASPRSAASREARSLNLSALIRANPAAVPDLLAPYPPSAVPTAQHHQARSPAELVRKLATRTRLVRSGALPIGPAVLAARRSDRRSRPGNRWMFSRLGVHAPT